MNGSNSNKKLLIFMSIFLLIVSSFVVASFTSSGSIFTFEGEPGDIIADQIFTLKNDNLTYNITDITFDFIPDSRLPNNVVNMDNFVDLVFPSNLGNTSFSNNEGTVDFDFLIPLGVDAIDGDFKKINWNSSKIQISGFETNPSNLSDTRPLEILIDVNIKIENNFGFYKNKIEFEIEGEDPRNISNSVTKTVQDGDTVILRITYENSFDNETLKFDDSDIEATLIVDGNVIVSENGDDIVEGDETGSLEVEFDVEGYDPDDKYPVEIRLEGITTDGGRHGEIFKFEIEVEEEAEPTPPVVGDSDGDGVNDDLDLCPNTSILCISDEAGCEMDPDNDGICNGVDRTPDGEVEEEQQISQNTISKQEESNEEPEEVEEKVVKKDDEGSGTGSFFFGLIVGFIGAALFFTLTKV